MTKLHLAMFRRALRCILNTLPRFLIQKTFQYSLRANILSNVGYHPPAVNLLKTLFKTCQRLDNREKIPKVIKGICFTQTFILSSIFCSFLIKERLIKIESRHPFNVLVQIHHIKPVWQIIRSQQYSTARFKFSKAYLLELYSPPFWF